MSKVKEAVYSLCELLDNATQEAFEKAVAESKKSVASPEDNEQKAVASAMVIAFETFSFAFTLIRGAAENIVAEEQANELLEMISTKH